MKTTVTRESATVLRLSVEATEDELAPAIDRAFIKLAQEVKVPGFRKGKVPKQVLQARIGTEAVREAALREAIPTLYAQAVVSEDLDPVSAPKIEVTSQEQDAGITFDATIEVRPEITLPEYAGVRVSRPSDAVTDDEVEQNLLRLQERFASLETVTRDARDGDYVLMNLRTYQHDKTVDEATGTDILYELGAQGFTPALDENLRGKKAGDIVKFNTTMPEGPSAFAGQEVSCEVLVKEVRKKIVPDLDDEFARTASEFDTLDELKQDIKAKVADVKKAATDQEVRGRVLETLVSAVDFETPQALVDEEYGFRLQRFSEQLRATGLGLDDYLAQSGQTEDQIESDLRAQAERNIRAQLLLEEIGKAEKLEATQEEIDDELRRHAEALRTDPVELRQQLESRGRLQALAGDIIRRKALDLAVERADINYEDQTAAKSEQSGPPAETEPTRE